MIIYRGAVPNTLPNPSLTWEKAAQYDGTLEFGVLNNRISGSATYYYKRTTSMLLNVTLPSSSGFLTQLENVGSMNNHGFEFSLSTKNIDKKFKWTTEFNISFNRNKVTNVDNLPPDAFESGQPGEGRVLVGYPVGQEWVVKFAGIAQNNEEIPIYDLNGNKTGGFYQIHAGQELFWDLHNHLMSGDASNANFYDNRVPVGSPVPKFVGGITNSFSYKRFDLNILFSFDYGNDIYNDAAKYEIGEWQSVEQLPEVLNYWTPQNHSTTNPSLAYTNTAQYPVRNSSRWIYDGSYLRLRSLSIGYSFAPEVCKKNAS